MQLSKTSIYYGSHPEYGEGDQEITIECHPDDENTVREYSFEHGHFSDNYSEIKTKYPIKFL